MKSIQFQEFIEVVGQGYVTMRKHNFPNQGFARKTIGNIIYIFARRSLNYLKFQFYMTSLENKTGKTVVWCPVPKGFIDYVGV